MGKIAVEGLAVLELTLLRNNNLILADRVVSVVTVLRLDRTNPLVFSNHVVNGREREHFALLLHRTSDLILLLELLEEFGTGFLQVGLSFHIEDVVGLQLGINIVLGSFFLRHLLIVIVLDFLLRLFVDDGESRDEHRKTLGSLIHGNKGQLVSFAVLSFLLRTLLVLHIVQVRDTVEGRPDRQFVAFLLGMEHQHHAVHSVVLPSAEVLGKGC